MMLNYLYTFLGAFMAPKVLVALGTVLGLILGDTLLGVFVAIKNGEFSFSKLAQFVQSSLIPYLGGLLVLALFSNSNAELSAIFFTIAAAITAKFVADIISKTSTLFGGLNIQFQSPIAVKKNDPAPENTVVSPSTDISTDTPASDKTVPDSNPAQ